MSYEASLVAAPIRPVTASQRALMSVRWLRLAAEFARAAWILRWRFPGLDRDGKLIEIRNWATRVMAILEVELECGDSFVHARGFRGQIRGSALARDRLARTNLRNHFCGTRVIPLRTCHGRRQRRSI
jgi:hypothetical protein